MSNLEQKIAKALEAKDITSSDLAALITETESSITTADETAKTEGAKAFDPALSPDPKKARQAMEDAEFTSARLKTVLPRLYEKHKVQAEAEYAAAWSADRDRVEAMRDDLAAELTQHYQELVAKMTDMLQRIATVDAMIDHVNGHAPPGERDRLRKTEQHARGVERFAPSGWSGLLSLVTDMKLPKFEADGNRYQYSWPPPQPTLAQMYVPPASFFIPVDPQAEADERQHKAREDNDKMKEFYQKQQREREKREQAEIEAARERDREACRERGGPP